MKEPKHKVTKHSKNNHLSHEKITLSYGIMVLPVCMARKTVIPKWKWLMWGGLQGKLLVAAVLFLTAIGIIGCKTARSTKDLIMTPTQSSMKGYELYSWQADSGWNFALVVGTNRLKTFDEITSPDVTSKSLSELRSRLLLLTKGEDIIWITQIDARLALPPQSIIDEVKAICQEAGLNLTITTR